MIGRFAFGLILAGALAAVLGWPTLATVIDAIEGESSPGGGLLTPIGGGSAIRPWSLAAETVRLVVSTEAMAMPLGLVFAFLLFRTDMPGRRFWPAMLALSACVPMPLLATGWLGGFGNLGRSQAIGTAPILVGRFAAAFVHAVAALPWVVWIVGIGLRGVEPELEESARLDLSPWRVARRVTLRRSLGAIAGAALAVAVLTAGDMTVTDLLAIRTYAEEAYLQYAIGNGPGAASAVALPPLIVLGTLIIFGANRLLRTDPARLVSTSQDAARWPLGLWRWPTAILVSLALGALIGLPLYSLVWRAGRVSGDAALGIAPHWSVGGLLGTLRASSLEVVGRWPSRRGPGEWIAQTLLTRWLPRSPLASSVLWASLGAIGSTALAWSLAWACRRPGLWRGATALCAALALAAPGPVAGMAMVLAYRDVPGLYGSPSILALTYVMRTWPYALLILWPAVRALPDAYFEAASIDGQGPIGRVLRVALPLTAGPIALAWAVAFVLSIGELPATWLLSPPGLSTITFRVFDMLHIGVESRLAGMTLVTLAIFGGAGMLVAAVRRVAHRGPSRPPRRLHGSADVEHRSVGTGWPPSIARS